MPDQDQKTNRTAFNVATVSAASLLQIINQFVFFSILASLYGTLEESDALAAALVIPTVLSAILTGSIAYVLIPELVAQFDRSGEDAKAWQLASFVGVVTGVLGLLISAGLYFGADPICQWLYREMSAQQQTATARLLRILSVQVVLTGGIAWAQAVHHSKHQFMIPAAGGVIGTALSVVVALTAGSRDIAVLAWAINLGSITSALVHVLPLARDLRWPAVEWSMMQHLSNRLWPLLLGAAFIRLDPLIDRILAAALDEGSVAQVNYAHRIMMAVLAIGTSSLALVAFPQLARRLSSEGETGFSDHLALAFRRLTLLVVPIAIGLGTFSVTVIGDLLERGEFTSRDSEVVGQLVFMLMGMFIGASAGELLARGFYTLGDTRTPTAVGVVSLAIGLTVKIYLFQRYGIWGIAFGVSFYYLLSATIMTILLVGRVGTDALQGLLPVTLQAIFASAIACGCSYAVYASKLTPEFLSSTWVAAPIGAISYFVVLLILGNSDARLLIQSIPRRRRIAEES